MGWDSPCVGHSILGKKVCGYNQCGVDPIHFGSHVLGHGRCYRSKGGVFTSAPPPYWEASAGASYPYCDAPTPCAMSLEQGSVAPINFKTKFVKNMRSIFAGTVRGGQAQISFFPETRDRYLPHPLLQADTIGDSKPCRQNCASIWVS